ncbi:mitochondrial genome maintenance exonuclease 1-like isoform X2 [Clavelina lepadiformis]|uniref:mitochondrial genome maintenance exonuclease 1-like isoform X2 n=1 Tax=Clavelina lepadiformis TaxID=159417 RepID=UPI0040417ED7
MWLQRTSLVLKYCQPALNGRISWAVCSCKRLLSTEDDVSALGDKLNFPLTREDGSDNVSHNDEKLPSVTRILQATQPVESALALLAWKRKMIAKLGEKGFAEMQKKTLEAGSACHSAIEQYLNGDVIDDIIVPESSEKLWSSVKPILKDVDKIEMVEGKCFHPHLKYYGFVDCVATYCGNLCVIDWKTSKRTVTKLNYCYDDPLQVAAYAGAVNCNLSPDKQVKQGVVVKIYHQGNPATALVMNEFTLEYYWRQWLRRLAAYNSLDSTSL